MTPHALPKNGGSPTMTTWRVITGSRQKSSQKVYHQPTGEPRDGLQYWTMSQARSRLFQPCFVGGRGNGHDAHLEDSLLKSVCELQSSRPDNLPRHTLVHFGSQIGTD